MFWGAASSCSDDGDVNSFRGNTIFDFVKIESRASSGMTFTLLRGDGNHTVQLFSDKVIPEGDDTKVGDRVVISYLPADITPGTSGQINLYGYIICYNSPVMEYHPKYELPMDFPPTVTNAFMADNYLNIVGWVYGSERPVEMTCFIQPGQEGNTKPYVTLYHSGAGQLNPARIPFYASYDMTPLLSKPGNEGFVLTVLNPTGNATNYSYDNKSNNK